MKSDYANIAVYLVFEEKKDSNIYNKKFKLVFIILLFFLHS